MPATITRRLPHVLGVAFALLLAAVLAFPGSAAAKNKLPRGFFGAVLDANITDSNAVSSAELGRQFALMHRSGVESVRTTFRWATINPRRGHYNWRESDRVVALAASHHVGLLPIVMFTPRWASSQPQSIDFTNVPPAKNAYYARFMRALVKRYGPRGSFFRSAFYRRLNKRKAPIHQWQVWNEPMQPFYWQSQPWWKTYGPMLRAAHAAIHRADHHAVVVTAGLSGSDKGPSWEDLRHIYGAAGRRSFDAVAVNQYTNAEGSRFTTGKPTGVKTSVNHLLQVGYYVRREMRRHHDRASKHIYLTEFGWPAAFGHLPQSKYKGLETTSKGASKRMVAFLQRLANNGRFPHPYLKRTLHARSLGITRAYWYTWASGFGGAPVQTPFSYSGLTSWLPDRPFARRPVLRTYRRAARRF